MSAQAVREREAATLSTFHEITTGGEPVVLRGLATHWPAVVAGRAGPQAIADYLRPFCVGQAADLMVAGPAAKGRFFYRDDFEGFNFERARVLLPLLLDQLLKLRGDPAPPALYAGAASAADAFPGWSEANPLPFPLPGATPRLWIGNGSRVSAHYDRSSNLAVVVAGQRRFALFPPDQGANLYVGPLDMTMAGQPSSLVDLDAPDLGRFPRFASALATMRVADLSPGDAIFMPPLWWHGVTAIGPLNLLANYWWSAQEGISPFPALVHAILAIRDLPKAEREAVRGWFDQYVFGDDAGQAAAHIPARARGVLGARSPDRDERARAYLLRQIAGD